MRILIDIGHPAHVHLFRHFYNEMKQRGHDMSVTVKEIASARQLLDLYNIPFITLGFKSDSLLKKAFNQLIYDLRMLRLVQRSGTEIGIGSSLTIAHVSRMSRMKSVMLDDDDDAVEPLITSVGHPFTDLVVSPDSLQGRRKKKGTIFYPGYHELAYLHPRRFTPDASVPEEAGLPEGEPYFVLRFNAFKAHHDRGAKGLSDEQKLQLVTLLKSYGRVVITTEKETAPEFAGYRLSVSPEKIHSLLWYSTMYIGDSQTMASEAAVLGVPSLRCNSFAGLLSSLEEEEKRYGLTYAFTPDDFERLLEKVKELLAKPDLRAEWQSRRKAMLADKIDVTAFLVWLVEGYPESVRMIRNDNDYLDRFGASAVKV
ncbi:MAG: DUF354 domain-containing protein [Bacteroidales bacterium]|nr:DUF354 domain-containing protein [Bacteroidales bacterium]MDT8374980.1 DUF354 domain-containing protein [Bacteroidales bacterium]